MTTEDRFWCKVEKRPDGCWEWKSAFSNGTPVFNIWPHGTVTVRRFVWRLVKGSSPVGKRTRRFCDNRKCINPDHCVSLTDKERFERLFSKVGECWLWNGTGVKGGYGQFSINGRLRLAHRCSYEFHIGKIPPGLQVLHKCDVPNCVNPNHLFLGTDADNTKDKLKKGRQPSKLSVDDVSAIRRSRMSVIYLAAKYCVSRTTIYQIKHRKTWKHI